MKNVEMNKSKNKNGVRNVDKIRKSDIREVCGVWKPCDESSEESDWKVNMLKERKSHECWKEMYVSESNGRRKRGKTKIGYT